MSIKLGSSPLAMSNPVAAGAWSGGKPIPLARELMRIVVRGGLALVSRQQTFRNGEDRSIEATMTFPVPVHATLCRLTAKIGDRDLRAVAKPRKAARQSYEQAIEEGKTAVLHEELIRGVHVLSVAHIPPGAKIAVTHSWIAAVSPRGRDTALLRVPVTVGQIYGNSPFNDADDLVHSAAVVHEAQVEIDPGSAIAMITGRIPTDGKLNVRLDAPIDVVLQGRFSDAVPGVMADDRRVSVSVIPDEGGDAPLDVAILVDRSSSMGDAASNVNRHESSGALTKHAAVVAGLLQASANRRKSDRTELWEFDNEVHLVAGPEETLATGAHRLGEPRGGTEIGAALKAVASTSAAGDIILVTDGLSHALEVQALANTGRRFTVVLVGEDAFEANVGRLAALTGGQIILATGSQDAAQAVSTAINSVRRSKPDFRPGIWPLDKVSLHGGGALVEAVWAGKRTLQDDDIFQRAVGAFAAAMAIPHLAEEAAVTVAVSHGIVCHLTSLVLIDEAGAIQSELPGQRKVPLMAARAGADLLMPALGERLLSESVDQAKASRVETRRPSRSIESDGDFEKELFDVIAHRPRPGALSLRTSARRVDWGKDPEALRRGDLSSLPSSIAALVIAASKLAVICALAGKMGDPIVIVIALMARSMAPMDRSADRLAKAVLSGLSDEAITVAMSAVGL